ncbi:MAG: CAAD domain-containing protein, partial [Nostoc sp.]
FEGAVNMARDMYNAIYSPLMKLAKDDIRGEQMKTVIPEENKKQKESEVQQPKSVDMKSTKVMPTAVNYAGFENSKIEAEALLSPADKPLNQESEVQQPKSFDMKSIEPIAVLESSKIDEQPLLQGQQVGSKFSEFLGHLPKYLGRFSTEYQLPIICFATIITATIAVKLVIAVLDVLNEIPQLNLVFELTGIGYATWFIFRYLLKASTRQELAAQISFIQKEIVQGQDS